MTRKELAIILKERQREITKKAATILRKDVKKQEKPNG